MQQSHISTRKQYRDPLAEAQFQSLEDSLLSLAVVQGQQDGLCNYPKTENEYRARFANIVFDRVQEALNEYGLQTQNISGVLMANKLEQASKEKIRAIQIPLSEEQAELKILEREAARIRPNQSYNLIRTLVIIGLLIIAASEGILAYPGFRAASLSTYSAYVTSIGLAIGVAIGAHLAAGYIRKAPSKLQYLVRLTGTHLTAFIVFFFLGLLRLRSYAQGVSTPDLDSSEITAPLSKPDCTTAWAICVSSTILFYLALYASIKYHKSKAESLSDQQYREKRNRIQTLALKIEERTREIAVIEQTTRIEQTEALSHYEYAFGHHRRLIDFGKRVLTTYSNTNLRYRTDGLCPEFFIRQPEHAYTSFFGPKTREE